MEKIKCFRLWYNISMENQQQSFEPATNEFLARMDAASSSTAPENKKKKNGIILGVILGVLVVVGGAILFFLMNSSEPEVKPVATYTREDEPEVDEEMEERNQLRKSDLRVLGKAVKKYQASIDGQLPGNNKASWNNLVAKFVDGGVIKDGADGENYSFGKACGFSEKDCIDFDALSWDENKHQYFVIYNADCKGETKKDVIVASTRKRHLAIFAVIEGDKTICTTND